MMQKMHDTLAKMPGGDKLNVSNAVNDKEAATCTATPTPVPPPQPAPPPPTSAAPHRAAIPTSVPPP